MLQLTKTGHFKSDFKIIEKRGYDLLKLEAVLNILITGKKLPLKYKEHPLKGEYNGYLDCHLGPDWILIFKRDESEKLIILVRTGTHSDLFG
jgi:mRNA interferase YafQ